MSEMCALRPECFPLQQIACLVGLTQTEAATGNLDDAKGTTRLKATIYITAWQALAGVAKVICQGKKIDKYILLFGW